MLGLPKWSQPPKALGTFWAALLSTPREFKENHLVFQLGRPNNCFNKMNLVQEQLPAAPPAACPQWGQIFLHGASLAEQESWQLLFMARKEQMKTMIWGCKGLFFFNTKVKNINNQQNKTKSSMQKKSKKAKSILRCVWKSTRKTAYLILKGTVFLFAQLKKWSPFRTNP